MSKSWCMAASLLASGLVWAQDAGVADTPSVEQALPELGLGWSLLKMVLGLGFVIAMTYLTLNKGLRRLVDATRTDAGGLLAVTERLSIDAKRALWVVRAGGRHLLLGITEGNITVLARLPAEDVEKWKAATSSPKLSPFFEKLVGKHKDGERDPP